MEIERHIAGHTFPAINLKKRRRIMEGEKNPRLGVQDKRNLFCSLLAMTERLLLLNRFPVDMEDFALSLQEPQVENAWRTINTELNQNSLSPTASQHFKCNGTKWNLQLYPEDKKQADSSYKYGRVFMNVAKPIDIGDARRHLGVVSNWCDRQARLESQCLRAAKVLKAIVHSCNTVGQYKRVSPDLLGFLPEKYREALGDYTKQSPYPAITVEPQEIDTTLGSLAFAALQPEHHSEAEFIQRPKWGNYGYSLEPFPRSAKYDSHDERHLKL
jgi:hypothetical protein